MIRRWTTALVGAVTLVLGSCPTAADASVRHQPRDLGVIRVAVLNFDPTVASEGGRRLHSVLGWTDPRTLAAGYRADVRRASGGQVRYRVVTWKDVDAFPASVDGLRFDVPGYLEFARTGSYPTPIMDYPRMLTESGLVKDVNRGTIDEIWLYGGPGFGYWEAAMAGPGAFDVNGGVYPDVPGLRRPVVLMGFSYERGAAEQLEDLCHRIEATMTRIYGGWDLEHPTTNWDQFGRNQKQSPAPAAVGTCHYSPNTRFEYDTTNPEPVASTADAWLHYPHLTAATTPVSSQTWGGPDYRLNYLRWWMNHLPRARGWNADGRLNDWWRYIYDYARYDSQGRPLRR
jgi:hypothetical protein